MLSSKVVIALFRILVVDDDAHIRRFVSTFLRLSGYEPVMAEDGIQALARLEEYQIDLIVLDVTMPNMNGYEFADTLRQGGSQLPILMLTAKQEPCDKRKGFLVGTDDYMTKPFDEEEMLLRIKALLRRSNIVHQRKITMGDVVVDYDALTVTKKGQVETLPPKEFYLLYKLLSYPNQIFTRYQLLDEIWGMDSEAMDSTVVVHMNRLRKRFADYSEFELVTVRGLGYKGVRHDVET